MKAVPESGSAICEPPLKKWEEAAKDNIESGEKFQFAKLRKNWRKEAIKIAEIHTASLGFDVAPLKAELPLLLSGHQPYFYHPGILYKYRMLTLADKNSFTRIFVTVDTDLCEGFPVKLPAFNGQYTQSNCMVAPSAGNDFFCEVSTNQEALETFTRETEKTVSTLPQKSLFKTGVDFLRREFSIKPHEKLCDVMVILRKKYCASWPGGVLEMPLSEVCETEEFFEFAYGLLSRAVEVQKCFNSILESYRKEHGIKSKANPFPDLAETGAFSETLFWSVDGKKRSPLFVKNGGNRLTLLLDGEIEIESGAELMKLFLSGGRKLWPRAVALSVILRIFLSDLFIHGIGGARYDAVTDKLIEKIYGLKPPGFVTASCTLKMPGMEDPSKTLADMNQTIRQMQFHPESFLEHSTEVKRITNEKNSLVEQIRLPDADKKTIGKKISQLNEALNRELEPIKAEIEGKIESAKSDLNRYNFLTDREFPYFLYPPDLMPGESRPLPK